MLNDEIRTPSFMGMILISSLRTFLKYSTAIEANFEIDFFTKIAN